jgi:ribosomal-protein-alanine N-acetyltransferase
LTESGDDARFHPHPLTRDYAVGLGSREGRDVYVVAMNATQAVGYGLLRGWDQGFEVPSLGIAVDHSWRGTGLADMLMEWLHSAARARGSTQVRLRVNTTNPAARRLYMRFGYRFDAWDRGEQVGTLDLTARRPATRDSGRGAEE